MNDWLALNRFPFTPLHRSWIHFLQLWHKFELLPTPFLHTLQNHIHFSSILSFILQPIITFIFQYSSSNLQLPIRISIVLSSHVLLSSFSASKIKSSAYNNSRGKPARSSRVIILITITNRWGLNKDPWCNPTFTLSALLSPSDYFLCTLIICVGEYLYSPSYVVAYFKHCTAMVLII